MHLPDVYATLKRQRVPVDIYASNWFVTMFSNDLSFDIIPTIIDLYLHVGNRALIQIALTLLSLIRPKLLKMSQDEIMVLMSSSQTRERIF